MKSVYHSKENCSGCTACQNSCPVNAITMESDNEGFLYPYINSKVCIECEICIDVCNFQDKIIQDLNYPLVYAIKHKNESIRMNSTSGGVFTAISNYILNENGVIYGVMFDKKLNVVHQRAIDKKGRDKFRGSKYVQSNLNEIFFNIKEDLKNKKKVLFTGTPCQVAGLKGYLGNEYNEQLILCDIVCLGVPSPLLWKEHIRYYEKVKKRNIKSYKCRSKVNGWHSHTEEIIDYNDTVDNKTLISQLHKILFHTNATLRPSCYRCPFTKIERISDLTIGDFWGIENYMPNFDDDKGVSLLLVNSFKGKEIFQNIRNDLIYLESNVDNCIQRQLKEPVKTQINRKKFWKDYHQNGYEYIIKKYANYNFIGKIKFFIKKILK